MCHAKPYLACISGVFRALLPGIFALGQPFTVNRKKGPKSKCPDGTVSTSGRL